jgi:hypothetical protein
MTTEQKAINERTAEWVRMQSHPELGKVLGYSWSTKRSREIKRKRTFLERWRIYRKHGEWPPASQLATFFEPILPGDPDYNPVPYKVTHIL